MWNDGSPKLAKQPKGSALAVGAPHSAPDPLLAVRPICSSFEPFVKSHFKPASPYKAARVALSFPLPPKRRPPQLQAWRGSNAIGTERSAPLDRTGG